MEVILVHLAIFTLYANIFCLNFRAFESEIRFYTGNDPLDVWDRWVFLFNKGSRNLMYESLWSCFSNWVVQSSVPECKVVSRGHRRENSHNVSS